MLVAPESRQREDGGGRDARTGMEQERQWEDRAREEREPEHGGVTPTNQRLHFSDHGQAIS